VYRVVKIDYKGPWAISVKQKSIKFGI